MSREITRSSYIGLFYTAPLPPPPWRVVGAAAAPALASASASSAANPTELSTQQKLDLYGLATCEGFPRRFPRELPPRSNSAAPQRAEAQVNS